VAAWKVLLLSCLLLALVWLIFNLLMAVSSGDELSLDPRLVGLFWGSLADQLGQPPLALLAVFWGAATGWFLRTPRRGLVLTPLILLPAFLEPLINLALLPFAAFALSGTEVGFALLAPLHYVVPALLLAVGGAVGGLARQHVTT
jgi:hypothetical protein